MAGLKIDTWAIIGAGVAMMAVVVGIMLALNEATNARIDSLQETMREEHAAMRAEHTAMREEHTAMREEHTAMRAEHTVILESLSQVAQRVSYVEGRLDIRRAEGSESIEIP